ncbi:hypothetical protein [Streptomyces albidoflavus]|uniref:hypothetical protein n=1 Tax=Streptomyces albidoflavus TaxID=1886 RepID=UPI0005256522|nr:hypothetical protein [Streptomyces albidoflavus]
MIARLPVTMAMSALLTSASGLPVGRGQQPGKPPPYYLLYSLDTQLGGPPFADMNDDVTFVYQVTCVSGPDPARPNSAGSADQGEWMADKAREAFLGRDPATGLWLYPIVVPGAKVTDRRLDVEAGATSDPGDAIMSYVLRPAISLTSI